MNIIFKLFCGMAALSLLSACSTSLNLVQPRNKAAIKLLSEMEESFAAGNCQLYHELYEKFSAEKPSAKLREKAYLYDGMCYENNGDSDKAVGVYRLAAELYPKNPAFAYRLALIYSQSGFYEKALAFFESSISKHYNEKESFAGAARASAALGRFPKATKYYVKALSMYGEAEKEGISIIKELAVCLINSKRYDEARAFIEKGHSIDSMPVWSVLAAKSYAREGKFKNASEEISRAIAEDNLREYRIAKGFYDYWDGNLEQASAAADRELAENPYDPLAAFLKGMALRSSGQREIADSYFKISACGEDFIGEISRKMSYAQLPPKEELCK